MPVVGQCLHGLFHSLSWEVCTVPPHEGLISIGVYPIFHQGIQHLGKQLEFLVLVVLTHLTLSLDSPVFTLK